jgi:Tol biopolymer transport system component
MVVVDNEGNETAPSLAPRAFNDFRWSPDGASVAYIDVMDGGIMIFTYNVDLGTTPKQITFEGNNREPVWSPDGTRVAFTSDREGGLAYDLYVKNVTDDSPPERILALEANQRPFHWASDSVLVFGTQAGSEDLWWMNPSDSTSATPYLESESNLTAVRISPSGDLAAYMSDETGEDQVFVRSFPDPRQPVLVSRDRGNHPRWAPEGNALYYWKGSPVDTLLVAQVSTDPTFSVTSVEPLFGADYVLRGVDLHPDGDRWIAPDSRNQGVASPAEPGQPEQFLIVTNWFSELRAALGEDDR